MHRVKCPYCEETFDRDKVDNIPIGRRYYHVECYNKFKEEEKENKKKRKPNIKICKFCNKEIDINIEPFKKVSNRYAHEECYDKNVDGEMGYIDKIYAYLKDINFKYDYVQCENQRKRYNKQGISNQDVFLTLKYVYTIKKTPIAGAQGRIGLVPYMVEEARNYFNNLEKKKEKITKELTKEIHKEEKIIRINNRENNIKRNFINLEELGE